MPNKLRISLEGQDLEAVELQYETVKEDWNEYRLLDGGRVRVKTTVFTIYRVLDANGNPALTPDGTPHIVVRHRTDITAS